MTPKTQKQQGKGRSSFLLLPSLTRACPCPHSHQLRSAPSSPRQASESAGTGGLPGQWNAPPDGGRQHPVPLCSRQLARTGARCLPQQAAGAVLLRQPTLGGTRRPAERSARGARPAPPEPQGLGRGRERRPRAGAAAPGPLQGGAILGRSEAGGLAGAMENEGNGAGEGQPTACSPEHGS